MCTNYIANNVLIWTERLSGRFIFPTVDESCSTKCFRIVVREHMNFVDKLTRDGSEEPSERRLGLQKLHIRKEYRL